MLVDEIRKGIVEILGNEVEFEGHFNVIIKNTDKNFHNAILNWVKGCKERKQRIYTSKKNRGVVAFIFKPNDARYRGILTKEKTGTFLFYFLININTMKEKGINWVFKFNLFLHNHNLLAFALRTP